MARPSGRAPRRHSTVKIDGVPHRQVPHCSGCDTQLLEINLPTLNHWEPGFRVVRKYPFAEPAFFCEPCRESHNLAHKSYVLVPMNEDQTLREALCALLESIQEVRHARADDDGVAYDDYDIGMCD